MVDWDVVVVGAGPAGAAAALAARQARPAARVLLMDRADFPRDKPCGDGIAPHALDVLARLGVTGIVDDYRPVHRLRLHSPGGASVAGRMPRPAHVVPRQVFDARLVRAAVARGAQLDRHTVRRVEQRRDCVVLDGDTTARVVVAADGANSVVRRALGHRPNPDGHLAVAIRGYASAPPGEPEQLIAMTDVGWPAYAWSFPIGDGNANVGYGEVLRAAPVTRTRLVQRLHELLPGLDEVTALRAHHLPLSSRRPRLRHDRVLLAGDALSLINPFTGEGIFYAVLSGALAGRAAVLQPNAGEAYRAALHRQLGAHLRDTTRTAALARRPWVVDAGMAAAGRDPRVFADLVELGLGLGRLTGRALRGTLWSLLTRPGEPIR